MCVLPVYFDKGAGFWERAEPEPAVCWTTRGGACDIANIVNVLPYMI